MAEPAALDPRPGVLLGAGRYQLDQLIGSGGMATVWRATDRRLGRTVAVKLISEALVDDPTYAERFAREARTAAGLSHANLVQVYDYGADEDQPFLVMEYVDGGTLADRLDRGPVVGAEAAAASPATCSRRSPRSTPPASSTGTSSRPTCCSPATGAPGSPISASPSRRTRPA